ncbi:unnamed protein product [Nesidiocoris tenuis]|uniref:FAM91 N-terminal domain-containing protein n=1 Tax=Nesidiocoris tenuis TaxID=355587 RepID=A0A6H5HKQ5_9HEMI|nr:unnamed protein product [Nesidiocoris tenuis]
MVSKISENEETPFEFIQKSVRHIRKNEQRYYEELLAYSQGSLLLYPYHLSDIIVKGLRVTPFQYYTKVLEIIMDSERSYDSLPNFTAADSQLETTVKVKPDGISNMRLSSVRRSSPYVIEALTLSAAKAFSPLTRRRAPGCSTKTTGK